MSPMSQVEIMHNMFPKCPICKSTEGYKFSTFYPLVACKSCKSEWALYEYGMELRATSESGLVEELLNKTYSFDFWKGKLKPQITGRIFAPMNCVGGKPTRIEPSKGYIVFKSEDTMVYVGEEKTHKKVEIEIPIQRLNKASVEDTTKKALVGYVLLGVAGAALLGGGKKFLVLNYRDAFGESQNRVFDFHDDKTAKQLVDLLKWVKEHVRVQELTGETRVETVKPQQVEEGESKFFCRYCGAQNKSDAVFCEKCGKKLK